MVSRGPPQLTDAPTGATPVTAPHLIADIVNDAPSAPRVIGLTVLSLYFAYCALFPWAAV